MNTQIEAYEANLKLVTGSAATSFKAYLGKIKKDMFEITSAYKGLESTEKPSSKNKKSRHKEPEGDLFGKAAEKEQEEAKVDLGQMSGMIFFVWLFSCSSSPIREAYSTLSH